MRAIYEPKGRAAEYAPLAVNLYQGCEHGCLYCYVPDIVHKERGAFHASVSPRPHILVDLEKDLVKMYGHGDQRPVFLCFTCDPYPAVEWNLKITRRAIELMHRYSVPVMLLTKAWHYLATRDFDLMNAKDWFGVTMTFWDEDQSEKWEPRASCIFERIESLRDADNAGISTWVSLEPVIDPDVTLRIIKEVAPYVDLFKVGKMNHMPEVEKQVDWKKFGCDAEALLKSLGKEYVIKEDLRRCMS